MKNGKDKVSDLMLSCREHIILESSDIPFQIMQHCYLRSYEKFVKSKNFRFIMEAKGSKEE